MATKDRLPWWWNAIGGVAFSALAALAFVTPDNWWVGGGLCLIALLCFYVAWRDNRAPNP
jgi:hypothetical protein